MASSYQWRPVTTTTRAVAGSESRLQAMALRASALRLAIGLSTYGARNAESIASTRAPPRTMDAPRVRSIGVGHPGAEAMSPPTRARRATTTSSSPMAARIASGTEAYVSAPRGFAMTIDHDPGGHEVPSDRQRVDEPERRQPGREAPQRFVRQAGREEVVETLHQVEARAARRHERREPVAAITTTSQGEVTSTPTARRGDHPRPRPPPRAYGERDQRQAEGREQATLGVRPHRQAQRDPRAEPAAVAPPQEPDAPGRRPGSPGASRARGPARPP